VDLEVLDLSSNLFEEFPEKLADCEKLKKLLLINNKIKEIPEKYLNRRPAIEELIINQN
jgi:Leucine-rich repeat (LRR) protein